MKTPLALRILIYVVILAVGVIIGMGIQHYYKVPLAAEVNLIDIATLVVTVFLAVYVPEVLDMRLQNTRDKKRLLQNRITQFQSILRNINERVQDHTEMRENDYLYVSNLLDISRHKLRTLIYLLEHANLKEEFLPEIKTLEGLTDQHEKLLLKRDSETAFRYTKEIQDREEQLYNELDKASSLLIFHISDN